VPQLVACGQPIEQHVARFQTSLASRERAVGRPDLTTAYHPARTPLESQLVEIWEELLGVSPIGVHDDFFELGGDSLLAMRLLPVCRDRMGVRLTVKMLLRGSSIEQLCRAIEAGEQGGDVLALKAPPFARHTLVCVPYAGGTELSFKPLAERLPDDWALWVVPPPRTVKAVEPLLDTLLRDLLQTNTPLTVYGHCGGSALALELARRLEVAGRPATRVIAAAFLPPLEGVSLSEDALASVQAGGDLMAFMKSLGGLPGVATEADAREAAANMHEDGVGYAALFDQFRAHLTSPLDTPLVTLFGTDDPLTLDWELRGASFSHWFRAVQSHHFRGRGHYFVHSEPELVADVLREESHDGARNAEGKGA
jgi:surfactin synthase thioesterase subunit/aryl carrier-like protein